MGAQAEYPGGVSPANVLITLLNDFLLVWGYLGPGWLRFAGRSSKHGVYARWSHCRWCCNWVGAPCHGKYHH